MLLLIAPLLLPLLAFILFLYYALPILSPTSAPLRRIPGPKYSLFTSLPLRYHELRASRTTSVHELHLKYGPVVRIAPTEVSFASPAAIKEIYSSGGSGYDKTTFYDMFRVYGRRTMFTMLQKEEVSRGKCSRTSCACGPLAGWRRRMAIRDLPCG